MNGPDEQTRGELRRPWIIWASGLVLGAVILLGVWLIFTDPAQPAQSADEASSVTSGDRVDSTTSESDVEDDQVGASSDRCEVEESDDTELLTEAPDVEWEIVNTLALPMSDEHGPFVFTDTESECYDRSPTSALIAADHASKWIISDDRRQALVNVNAPGPGLDRLLALHDEEEAGGDVRDPSAVPGSYCQMAGFSFIDFSPDQAIIDVVLRCPEGGYGSFISTMVWDEGRRTWLAVLQSDGTRSATVKSVDSLEGFIVWGAI